MQYFISGVASIHMGFFLSAFLNGNQGAISAILIFAILPFLIAVEVEKPTGS